MIGAEAIVYPEAVQYLGVNPACISILQNGTRELVWGLLPNNPQTESYHTIRWFSDREKQEIQNTKDIQLLLSRYI